MQKIWKNNLKRKIKKLNKQEQVKVLLKLLITNYYMKAH